MKNSQKKKTRSIKMKLLGTIIPIVTVVVIALIVIAYTISKGIIKESATNQLVLSVRNQKSQIDEWITNDLLSFEAIKHLIEGSELDDETLQAYLDQFYGYNNDYPDGLYVASTDGTMIKPTESSKTSEGFTNDVWFKEGLTRINMQFGTPYRTNSGENFITASGILMDGGETLRVIGADVSLAHVSLIVNSKVDMDSAESLLVDKMSGTILATRDSSRVFTNLTTSDPSPMYASIATKINANDLNPYEVDEHLVVFEEIPNTTWILVSDVPTSTIYSDLASLRTIMIIVGILAVIALAVLVERMTNLVVKPIKALTSDIIQMANGDFTISIDTRGNDEISAMGQSVQKFVQSMRGMITDIDDISNTLGNQAAGSSEVSREMFNASVIQADSMVQLNQTVENLSISVNEIANSASTLAQVVADTKQDGNSVKEKMEETIVVSKQGQKDMEKISSAMNEISTSISQLVSAVNNVGKASDEITTIVSVIGSIADETALLSLNASIEAARAGEAGKGFAVVATEIAKLANTSADSVDSIGRLISEVNRLVKDTIKKSDESTREIQQSSELVLQAISTFNEIFQNIEDTNVYINSMISKIEKVDAVATDAAAISEEQAASTEEISNTAGSMVAHANNISKNSETVSDDAKSLATTAHTLEEQIKMFKF